MPIRLSPVLVVPVVLGAAMAGYLIADRPSSAAPSPPPAETAAAAVPAGSSELPPNHPAIAGMGGHGAHGGGATTNPDNQQAPPISWTVPAGWQSLPNPSPMRLATYKVDGAELSVARVGGTVDMNVQRWTQQFEGTPRVDRSEQQVRGVKVTVVRIAGTFLGSGMTPAAPPEKRDGWAMLAAVVESTGTPYFFKLLGPADQVDRARAGFDALVGSVTPNGT